MTATTDPDPLGFRHIGTRPRQADELGEQIRLAHALADAAVIADIESNAAPERIAGQLWYDVLPMLSPHEHGPEEIDMATQALRYAVLRGLTQPHPTHAHVLRITPKDRTR